MSLPDRKRVERRPVPLASHAFCESGGSSIPPQEGPDPHSPFRNHAALRDCRKLLVAERSTLWLNRNKSYYVLADHSARRAYLVLGCRAGQLEADLRRLGYDPDRIATALTVRNPDSVGLQDCLRRYFWMDPVEEEVMLSFRSGRG